MAGDQSSVIQQQAQSVTSSATSTNVATFATSQASASLASAGQQNQFIQKIKAAKLQEQMSSAAISAAQQVNMAVDAAVSAVYGTIKPVIDQLKKIPPKLKSAVDVQGAAAGVYDKIDQTQQSLSTAVNNIIVSAEVPIVSVDYYADPPRYPNLQTVQYLNNKVTDADCLSSGYTKVEQTVNQEWLNNLMEQLGLPVEDRDVVAQQMEKLFNVTVKTTWNMVSPAVSMVGNLASIDVIQDMVKALTNAIDGVVKVISVKVDEASLDAKLAQQDVARAKASNQVELAKSMKSMVGESLDRVCQTATDTATAAISEVEGAATATAAAAKDAFKQLKMPEMPSDIKDTFVDLYDAIIMVKDNISNIYIVLLLKLIGQILDCFNQVIDKIGVPSVPSPLSQIPQLIADAQKVFEFVMGLPVSFVTTVKSIAKKKVKALQVSQLPTPPQPVQTKTPLPPTSEDVQKPQTTWSDVEMKLKDQYRFSGKDAAAIVTDIQQFYDGSDEAKAVYTGGITEEVEFEVYGVWKKRTNYRPDYIQVKREMVQPMYCYEMWIDTRIGYDEDPTSGEKTFFVKLPHKGEYGDNVFYEYTSYDNKMYIPMSGEFGLHTYTSQPV